MAESIEARTKLHATFHADAKWKGWWNNVKPWIRSISTHLAIIMPGSDTVGLATQSWPPTPSPQEDARDDDDGAERVVLEGFRTKGSPMGALDVLSRLEKVWKDQLSPELTDNDVFGTVTRVMTIFSPEFPTSSLTASPA